MLDRSDDEGSRILPLLVETWTEDGVQVLLEVVCEGVEMLAGLDVVEGNVARLVIQEDSHLAGWRRQRERQARRVQGFDLAALQPQAPEAGLGTQLDLALAPGRAAAQAQGPGRLAARVHLPVVAAGAQSLAAQDEEGRVEALGPLRLGALALFISDLATVVGHGQVPLGRGRVEDHLTWTRTENRHFLLCLLWGFY